jgi:uncharacterized membrane protein
MTQRAAITVLRGREELERLWHTSDHAAEYADAEVSFVVAPGDRGTEIHVELDSGGLVKKLSRSAPLAKVKDDLRRFKQRVETGEVARSDGVPEGELAERKLKQRPAQPLEKVGA